MSTYTPSQNLKDALTAYQEALDLVEQRRNAAYDAIADDMKEHGVTNAEMAEHLPWTEENVRKIANSRGVPKKPAGPKPGTRKRTS
jgi:hypothetical protein